MKLTEEQVKFYHENGYLKIDGYFDENEIDLLKNELPNTVERDSPRIILEDNGEIRSVFAPHFVNTCYDNLGKLEKLVVPSGQIIGNPLYLHQYKINSKKGLKGDWWEWHQDFPYWHIDDGIEKPDMVSVMVFLHDTDAFNGPLLLIPKSHKLGIVKFKSKDQELLNEKFKYNMHHKNADYLSSLNSNIKFTIDHDFIKEQVRVNGIFPATGPKGTVLFFHGNIFHASNVNLSPFDRDVVIITYNSVNNLPLNSVSPRPDFLAGRNYEPLDGNIKSLSNL